MMNVSASERQAICKAIAALVGEQTAKLRARITALETRLTELESAGIRYCGVHQRAVNYKRGDCVTFDGSMFVAVVDTGPNEIPSASNAWQLAVKRGADARSSQR